MTLSELGHNSVERGRREAAFALGMRKTQKCAAEFLKDTSLGYLIT